MIKNKKGITLVVLIITVVVLLILSATAIQYANMSSNTNNYNKMVADIEVLEDKVSMYYSNYAVLPINNQEITEPDGVPTGTYREINLELLDNLTLNFGSKDGTNDYYIIDIYSHEVYYKEGITLNGVTYYSN